MSFVWGEENVEYLHKRFDALSAHHLFEGMEYSEEKEMLQQWIPLVMKDRDAKQRIAATRMDLGTDVNFGALTRKLFRYLFDLPGVTFHLAHEVRDLVNQDGTWNIEVKNLTTGNKRNIQTKFIFIGAGGGSLPLLKKSGIPESKGYGGFPVSGQWLICNNQDIIAKHNAKVYGKASVVPHP
jgi:malate dehydrogenase (quinone)